jgi:hypothetical protein
VDGINPMSGEFDKATADADYLALPF